MLLHSQVLAQSGFSKRRRCEYNAPLAGFTLGSSAGLGLLG